MSYKLTCSTMFDPPPQMHSRTTGAWPYQPLGGWKGSGNMGKAIASFHYLALCLREQSQTMVE